MDPLHRVFSPGISLGIPSYGGSRQRSQSERTQALESVSHLVGWVTLGKLPDLPDPLAAGLENLASYTDLRSVGRIHWNDRGVSVVARVAMEQRLRPGSLPDHLLSGQLRWSAASLVCCSVSTVTAGSSALPGWL